ncbi:MAG: helix-turn-helix domain-containing protein [Akkermansiaceae bacterium]|nr:helix-turn-helix domain-containing protein [Akkermansiaceae bacterium]
MARKRGRLDFNNEASEIGKRHRAEKTGWKKERLLAIKLLLEGELDIAAVAHLVGRHRNSINDWIKLFRNSGIEALLKRGEGSGRKGKMTDEAKTELTEKLKAGEFRINSIYYQLGKLGGRLKVARPSHLKKDEEAASAFTITLAEKMKELELPTGRKIKLWVYDKMRY